MIFIKTENSRLRDSLAQLRESALQKFVWITGVCGWVALTWALWPLTDQVVYRHQMRPVSLFLMLIAAISYVLIERGIILASVAHIAGLVMAIMPVVGIFQAIDAVYLFIVPVIFASVLLGQRAVMLTAASVIVFNLSVAPAWLGLSWMDSAIPTAVTSLIAAVVIISTRNLYTALWWALDGFEIAQHNQNLARERKAELEQALKSLDVAAYNLRRLNYALSLAQKRAEEARQLKQQFAQTISHELRTPLNLIVGFSETMIQSPEYYGQPLPPAYLRDLSIVYRNANHLQNLVNDVLDLARIEAAQMTLQIEHHVLAVLLDEVVNMAQSMTESNGLTFHAEIETTLIDVWLDSIRIKQVLYNLLSNSVRFTEKGSITLRISQQSQDILFEVIDTGIGIEADDIPRIFEPFCQLENPMRRRIGGAGLGLPISRQLVRLHGGELGVESQPGEGSTFYFTIPIRPASVIDDGIEFPAVNVRPLEIKDENILLVITRNFSTASLLARHLEQCRTVVAQDLERARCVISQLVPQAVLVDTTSMSIDIAQLATSEHLSQTLVISCPLPGETLLPQHLSVDGYLVKPVSRESLWNTLRQFDVSFRRILVVDDDPDFVRMIVRMLDNSLNHYQIDCAYNGREAMMMIMQHRPDLVLLDLHMPNFDGFEVIHRLRTSANWLDIPIVVVSAQDQIDMSNFLMGEVTVTRLSGIKPLELVRWVQSLLML
jgi:signal transduction histidine kinase/CheY-like chemotaxis protein